MQFARHLREGVRRGRITCSVRIWTHPHVKPGGRYRMGDGEVVVDSIERIRLADVTDDLAQESGFAHVKDLLQVAKHGRGRNVYLVRFHYVRPGGWDVASSQDADLEKERAASNASRARSQLLRRIRRSSPVAKSG